MSDCRATFLMTAYNSEDTIAESINSVLSQTVEDFEFIIVDDASTDSTPEIIKSFNDDRISYIRNEENLYIDGAANKGLELVKTKYLLRIDSDDICYPERLRIQLEFMEANPEIGVCGSYIRFFGTKSEVWKMPLTDSEIKAAMVFNNSIANPSVIVRAEILTDNNLKYRDTYRYPPMEDYDLWMRMIPLTKFANIDKVLVDKRVDESTSSIRYENEKFSSLKRFFKEHMSNFGLDLNESEVECFVHMCLNYNVENVFVELMSYNKLLKKVMDNLSISDYFESDKLQTNCRKKWMLLSDFIPLLHLRKLNEFIKLSTILNIDHPLQWYIKKKIRKILP